MLGTVKNVAEAGFIFTSAILAELEKGGFKLLGSRWQVLSKDSGRAVLTDSTCAGVRDFPSAALAVRADWYPSWLPKYTFCCTVLDKLYTVLIFSSLSMFTTTVGCSPI